MTRVLPVIDSNPDILGGTPIFHGTRVPVGNLLEYAERGRSLDEFLDAFPTVSREQAAAVLAAADNSLSDRARTSG